MTFASESFDAIIDKGCLDAFSTSIETVEIAEAYVSEAHRVLRTNGKFLLISFAPRDLYAKLLTRFSWSNIQTGTEFIRYKSPSCTLDR